MSKVAIIYSILCVIRTNILYNTSLFPAWTALVWVLVAFAVAVITLLIEVYKDGK